MSNHIAVTGTGRAGTSFLVQYLAACGLETHLAANPDGQLDENANAGLEDVPYEGIRLPYVIKSPWLFELADYIVERTDLSFDAVIIPMRDIVDAATSRVVLDMRARYGNTNVHSEVARWENWGVTPGGIVYSLNPMDQARILALGFHEIIRALVRKNVPLIFLDFPLLIEDGAYLWSKLEPVLSQYCSREFALAVHAKLADPDKVRAGKEINDRPSAPLSRTANGQGESLGISYPSHDALDRNALIRELMRLRHVVNSHEATVNELRHHLGQATLETETIRREYAEATQEAEKAGREHADERHKLNAAIEAARAEAKHLEIEYEHRLAIQTVETSTKAAALESTVRQILGSRSWKVTAPLRFIGGLVRRDSART